MKLIQPYTVQEVLLGKWGGLCNKLYGTGVNLENYNSVNIGEPNF